MRPEAKASPTAARELPPRPAARFALAAALRSLDPFWLIQLLIETIFIARRKEASSSLSTETV
jgi:hypothetical protein